MRFKLIPLMLAISCLPAMAGQLPMQGNRAIVSGRAQVERGAQATYIYIDSVRGRSPAVIGVIPFGNENSFPDLAMIDGHQVTIHGVVYWDGAPKITLTDPRQLSLG